MALTNDEQRTLDEIERALREEDPKFAATVNLGRIRRHQLLVGAAGFLLGMILLVVGEMATQALMAVGVVVSIAGFLMMIAVAAWMTRRRPRDLIIRRAAG